MSDQKISQLGSAVVLQATDYTVIRRGSANFYVTGQMFIDACLFDDTAILTSIASLQSEKLDLDGGNGPMTGNLDMGANFIFSTGVPSTNAHLVNKVYVDGKFLPLAGGTLTGFATLHSNPSSNYHAATKIYVDTAVAAIAPGIADTNELTEGSDNSATGSGTEVDGNKYFYTAARFDARLASKTTDSLTEGSTNKYFTTALFDSNFTSKNTDDLAEGAGNLYYTTARVRTSLSAPSGPLLYDSSTGIFSFDDSGFPTITYGATTRLPYMNGTNDGFLYSANLTFNGTKLVANQLQISTYTMPTADGTNGQFLVTNGSGTISFVTKNAADLGGVLGSGTLNYIPRWTPDGTTLGNSSIQDNGNSTAIGTSPVSSERFNVSTSTVAVAIAGYTTNTIGTVGTGLAGSADGVLTGTNTGVTGRAANATKNIGGKFTAEGGDAYGIQIIDGTETTAGRFLKNITANGEANWVNITTADISTSVQSVTSSATVTATSTNDLVKITAQAEALTLANPSGAFTEGQPLIIRIKDNGTARAISYGAKFRAIGVTLPTTTVISKTLYLGVIYNSTDDKFDILGINQEA
jgi:hypothetical protein